MADTIGHPQATTWTWGLRNVTMPRTTTWVIPIRSVDRSAPGDEEYRALVDQAKDWEEHGSNPKGDLIEQTT